jgi:hypothetical protein
VTIATSPNPAPRREVRRIAARAPRATTDPVDERAAGLELFEPRLRREIHPPQIELLEPGIVMVAIAVHVYAQSWFYLNNRYVSLTRKHVGSLVANVVREAAVGSACGGYRNHGFVGLTTRANLLSDPTFWTVVTASGIDIKSDGSLGGVNKQLSGSRTLSGVVT